MRPSRLRRAGAGALVLLAGLVLAAAAIADVGAHREPQTQPIALGTSGGNVNDISTMYCCSGTLGALVHDAQNTRYVLSNNHVLARNNRAQPGELISQPGLIDNGCGVHQIVAELHDFAEIQFRQGRGPSGPTNEVDAAIAVVVADGAVHDDGRILGIGPISHNTRAATLGMAVQKSGRTTGHTYGTVEALNVTVNVGFPTECGGSQTELAQFVGQIRIGDGSFSAGGDSGSIVVEQGEADPANGLPRAIGLLFAGSSTSTLINPIDSVLDALNVSLVSGAPADPEFGSVHGSVTDAANGEPIAGATVSIESAGRTTTTLASGSYTLDEVPAGTHVVSVTAAGYAGESRSVNVEADTVATANFALSAAAEPPPGDAAVSCVFYETRGGRANDRHLEITARAVDAGGTALAGARLDIRVEHDGAFFVAGTGAVTDGNGEVTYTANNAPAGTYTVAVTRLGDAVDVATPDNAFTKGTDPSPTTFCDANVAGGADAGRTERAFGRAARVLRQHGPGLFEVPGVVGHGIGRGPQHQPVIEIYLERENGRARARIPAHIENVPVRVIVTGPFRALPRQCAMPDETP